MAALKWQGCQPVGRFYPQLSSRLHAVCLVKELQEWYLVSVWQPLQVHAVCLVKELQEWYLVSVWHNYNSISSNNVYAHVRSHYTTAWGRINNPTENASSFYHTSTQGTKVVVEAIKGCGEFSYACHLDAISRVRHESRMALEEVVPFVFV